MRLPLVFWQPNFLPCIFNSAKKGKGKKVEKRMSKRRLWLGPSRKVAKTIFYTTVVGEAQGQSTQNGKMIGPKFFAFLLLFVILRHFNFFSHLHLMPINDHYSIPISGLRGRLMRICSSQSTFQLDFFRHLSFAVNWSSVCWFLVWPSQGPSANNQSRCPSYCNTI
jgi:hypothetical protein